jgi:Domain of unknown function (DUF4398)
VRRTPLFFAALFVTLPACGPLIYSVTASQAKSALRKAEAMKAEEKDPYHYWRAAAFLEKAKEEAGYSDFQPAIKYSRIAKESAKKAIQTSQAQSKQRGPNEKK